ncbi:hypothetical protein SAMN04489726_6526 [Allokutzneria albata]|uniref:PA containing protein n=2 Tax=Allokutzneria albata TaxID=211114 RepID=A0A1H0B827_ALLAB|nr:hypothetical protein [Allokutzneria albata]SDN41732.1 hypothetical protein SAMN04489726_6526 [Allokutzneria albata]
MSENNHSTMSFDRMRNMLVRAAEIRESEQQQIFDALDEIHARMSPLESLGAVRKRISELPDRTEVSVLAERLDEALAKLEAQDGAIAGLGRAVDGLVDKLAVPFTQLDGRLDGVSGRMEGVHVRMDGLEDKLAHIHKRLDDLDLHLDKQDGKTEAVPGLVTGPMRERLEALETVLRGRIDEVDEGVHEHLDGTREALQRSLTESTDGLRAEVGQARTSLEDAVTAARTSLEGSVADARTSLENSVGETHDALQGRFEEVLARPAVDHTDQLDALAERLDGVNSRLEGVDNRIDGVEGDLSSKLDDLGKATGQYLDKLAGVVGDRPTNETVLSLVRKANEETERRNAAQLDEAMATFAELILGGGAPTPPPPPAQLPRPQRRARQQKVNGKPRGEDKDAEIPEEIDA